MHSTGTPSTNGDNGLVEVRDGKGRFLPGNPGGPGNPNIRHVAAWRQALNEAVSPEDVAEVAQKLVTAAKASEAWAVHELFDRLFGKPRVSLDAAVSVAGREVADADADEAARRRAEEFLAACERERLAEADEGRGG